MCLPHPSCAVFSRWDVFSCFDAACFVSLGSSKCERLTWLRSRLSSIPSPHRFLLSWTGQALVDAHWCTVFYAFEVAGLASGTMHSKSSFGQNQGEKLLDFTMLRGCAPPKRVLETLNLGWTVWCCCGHKTRSDMWQWQDRNIQGCIKCIHHKYDDIIIALKCWIRWSRICLHHGLLCADLEICAVLIQVPMQQVR